MYGQNFQVIFGFSVHSIWPLMEKNVQIKMDPPFLTFPGNAEEYNF